MKTHVHHALEAALKKVGLTLDQVDQEFNKSRGWTWLVLQGKPQSPSILPLLPEFYRIIRERSIPAVNDLIREIVHDPALFNGSDRDAYLDGVEDATAYLLQKIRERELKHA